MDYLNEEINIETHKPIFIILTEGKTPLVSTGISKITKSKFTHASISFDPLMKDIYSFNFRNHESGLIKENLFKLSNSRNIGIFVFFVDLKTKRKIMKNFNDFLNHKEETKFSFTRLFLKIFNLGKEKNKYSQVCSSFVSSVLKDAGINIAETDIKLVSPADLHKGIQTNKTIYPLYYGKSLDFDAVKIQDKLKKLYENSKIQEYSNYYNENFLSEIKYQQYVKKMKQKGLKYLEKEEWEKANNVKNNMKKLFAKKVLKGEDFDKKKAYDTIDNKPSVFKQKVLQEGLDPDSVDKSNYNNFNLFNLFNIYTTDESLQTNEVFISKMRWVKERLEDIASQANFKLYPFDLTLCATFEDLNVFYDHKAPKWVTGFTYGNSVFMKGPSIYKGELYYNIVLHESIHVMLYNNLTVNGNGMTREREEGFAVFFSTPLNSWLKELNHNGANWFYYENAIDIQDDYLNGGMALVLKKSKKRKG